MMRKLILAVAIALLVAGLLVVDARRKAECKDAGGTWVGGSQRGAGCIGDDKGLL